MTEKEKELMEKAKQSVMILTDGLMLRVDYTEVEAGNVLCHDENDGKDYRLTVEELKSAKFYKLQEF